MDIKDIYPDLTADKNFVYSHELKTVGDLITQMEEHGLSVGSSVDMSGSVIRVPVRATATVRPDKGTERSGWYFIYDNGNGNFFAQYGNWRTGDTHKFSSVSFDEYDPQEQLKIRQEIEKRLEEERENRKIHQAEIAKQCQDKYETFEDPKDHKYLEEKKIKAYGIRSFRDKLVIPLYDTKDPGHKITSLQYIDPKGTKRFTSGGLVKGSVFNIGFNLQEISNLKKIFICEGYATAASIYLATGLPVLCVFSANFALEALNNLRRSTNAEFILALDNDKTGVGQEQTEKIIAAVHNCRSKIPEQTGLDYNDIHCELGIEEVRRQLLISSFNLKQYSIRGLDNNPPKREWIVENIIESGKNGVLASIGGVGKSFSILGLAKSIAGGSGVFMGQPVSKKGNVLVISAEDTIDEVHRRLAILDPEGQRFNSVYDVYVMSVSELGRPITLIKNDVANGLHITKQAYDLMDSMETIPNLEMVIFDPIQAFLGAETNSNEVGQLYSQYCQMIATKFNTGVLSVHHMSKQGLVSTDDSMTARMSIRGASSIIDSSRYCIAYFLCDEDTAREVCMQQGIPYNRLAVIRAAVVKANSEADMTVKTMVRRNGVLEVVNEDREISWT